MTLTTTAYRPIFLIFLRRSPTFAMGGARGLKYGTWRYIPSPSLQMTNPRNGRDGEYFHHHHHHYHHQFIDQKDRSATYTDMREYMYK